MNPGYTWFWILLKTRWTRNLTNVSFLWHCCSTHNRTSRISRSRRVWSVSPMHVVGAKGSSLRLITCSPSRGTNPRSSKPSPLNMPRLRMYASIAPRAALQSLGRTTISPPDDPHLVMFRRELWHAPDIVGVCDVVWKAGCVVQCCRSRHSHRTTTCPSRCCRYSSREATVALESKCTGGVSTSHGCRSASKLVRSWPPSHPLVCLRASCWICRWLWKAWNTALPCAISAATTPMWMPGVVTCCLHGRKPPVLLSPPRTWDTSPATFGLLNDGADVGSSSVTPHGSSMIARSQRSVTASSSTESFPTSVLLASSSTALSWSSLSLMRVALVKTAERWRWWRLVWVFWGTCWSFFLMLADMPAGHDQSGSAGYSRTKPTFSPPSTSRRTWTPILLSVMVWKGEGGSREWTWRTKESFNQQR